MYIVQQLLNNNKSFNFVSFVSVHDYLMRIPPSSTHAYYPHHEGLFFSILIQDQEYMFMTIPPHSAVN